MNVHQAGIDIPFVCPRCRASLTFSPGTATCSRCTRVYNEDNGVWDFVEGNYYDSFEPGQPLLPQHACGLALEVDGATTRAAYYIRLLQSRFADLKALRVLDCGCGNGLMVEHLRGAGIEAWGNDNSALRKWQWQQRQGSAHLVVASGGALPFPAAYFDVVISSGVLEHIGVDESGGKEYTVRPRPTRDAERSEFLRELIRVTRLEGSVFLDFPNGAFPLDFWHGVTPGGARFHSRTEGFLPTHAEVAALLSGPSSDATVHSVSPRGRLAFRQVSTRWVGRMMRPLAQLLFWLLDARVAARLLSSAANPYIVLQIKRKQPKLRPGD